MLLDRRFQCKFFCDGLPKQVAGQLYEAISRANRLAARAEDAGGEDGHPEEDVADRYGNGAEDGPDEEAAVFGEEGSDAAADGAADERNDQEAEDGGECDVHVYSRDES